LIGDGKETFEAFKSEYLNGIRKYYGDVMGSTC